MDFDLKQWKNQQQHESEEDQPSAKIPRLLLETPHHPSAVASALPLFVPEPNSRMSSSLSAFSDSTTTRFSGMGCLFSLAQWQELELQALIFKYMLAGAPVPAELLHPIKKSLLNSPAAACYLYPFQQYQHYQPTMLQSGYWGRNAVDPEPGRCRRTDGKKWRCSREVVPAHKYCERHVHRGRNRSRKLVETATPTAIEGDLKTPNPPTAFPLTTSASGTHFALSGSPPPTNLIQLNQRTSENKAGNGLLNMQNGNLCGEGRSDGQLLRQFFDDWPRLNQDTNIVGGNGGPSTTCLSISTPDHPSSDFSLKLSTGNGEVCLDGNGREERPQLDWTTGWVCHQVSSMGGPLAEALRSSTSNASPTSVLYGLRRGTASDTSSVST
ncbi:Growth-regulating factor [Thalictrum thalictroides]|uniref:Growth-regulating factor n=1 Tax=Thalictrum thalictroides TaxID=46969 RepID=A0A7J6URT0_THATH|nr:Growth-regulating factor [Thalictrum thalictroides]